MVELAETNEQLRTEETWISKWRILTFAECLTAQISNIDSFIHNALRRLGLRLGSHLVGAAVEIQKLRLRSVCAHDFIREECVVDEREEVCDECEPEDGTSHDLDVVKQTAFVKTVKTILLLDQVE